MRERKWGKGFFNGLFFRFIRVLNMKNIREIIGNSIVVNYFIYVFKFVWLGELFGVLVEYKDFDFF